MDVEESLVGSAGSPSVAERAHAGGGDHGTADDREEEEPHEEARARLRVHEGLAGRAPDVHEHDREEEEHHDAARVDEDLDGREELGTRHDEERRDAEEREEEEQSRVDGLSHRDDADGAENDERREEPEEEGGRHRPSPRSTTVNGLTFSSHFTSFRMSR